MKGFEMKIIKRFKQKIAMSSDPRQPVGSFIRFIHFKDNGFDQVVSYQLFHIYVKRQEQK